MKGSYRRKAINPYSLMSGTLAAGAYRYARLGQKSLQAKNAKKASLPLKSVRKAKKPYSKKAYSKSTSKSLSKRIRKLEKRQVDTISLLTYKYDNKDTLKPTAGSASYGYQDALGISQIELAIAQCRYFDPSAPATLITGSLATPTYSQNVLISSYAHIVIKNNYQVPCVVTFGIARPRQDTSINPTTALYNGLVDIGNPDNASTLISYKDSPQFNDLWRVKLKSKYLAPGEQVVVRHGQKQFTYDPALYDSHNQSYQKETKSAVFIYRCQGVLGHDTVVTTQQGILPAGIDVYVETTIYVRYNSGGASVKTLILSENASQSFTNGGVVSQIVADNQSYSIN